MKKAITTAIGQIILVSVVVGIIEFIVYLILIFNSLGDEDLSQGQMNLNDALLNFIGFPLFHVIEDQSIDSFIFSKYWVLNLFLKTALGFFIYKIFREVLRRKNL